MSVILEIFYDSLFTVSNFFLHYIWEFLVSIEIDIIVRFPIISLFKYFFSCENKRYLHSLSWSGQAWMFRGLLCLIMKFKLWHLKYYWPCKVNFSLTRNIFLAAHLFTRLIGVSGPLVFARLGTFFSQEMATHIFFLLKGVYCRNLQI